MFQFRQWFAENVGFSDQLAHNLINSAAIIVLLYGLRFLTMRAVFRQTEEVSKRYKWRKGITYITTFLAIFLVGRIWLEGLQSVATFAGLFAAGLEGGEFGVHVGEDGGDGGLFGQGWQLDVHAL